MCEPPHRILETLPLVGEVRKVEILFAGHDLVLCLRRKRDPSRQNFGMRANKNKVTLSFECFGISHGGSVGKAWHREMEAS